MNPSITPNYDPMSGWAPNTLSPLGGMRGKRIDAAIDEIAAVNPVLGAYVPRFVLGTFWKAGDTNFDFAGFDPTRFAPPTDAQLAAIGITLDQVNQILWNEQARVNFYFGLYMSSQNPNFVSGMYRGEKTKQGFPTYDPAQHGGAFVVGMSQSAPSAIEAAQNIMAFPHAMPFALVPGIAGRMEPKPLYTQMATDHLICDVWWDLSSDINVARYIRNWAIAFGVNVAPEPAS